MRTAPQDRAASARCCGPSALSRAARTGSISFASTCGEGREVHDGVGPQRLHYLPHRVVVAHVQARVIEGMDLVMRGDPREEGTGETPAGPRDDDPHPAASTIRGIVTTSAAWARRSQPR